MGENTSTVIAFALWLTFVTILSVMISPWFVLLVFAVKVDFKPGKK